MKSLGYVVKPWQDRHRGGERDLRGERDEASADLLGERGDGAVQEVEVIDDLAAEQGVVATEDGLQNDPRRVNRRPPVDELPFTGPVAEFRPGSSAHLALEVDADAYLSRLDAEKCERLCAKGQVPVHDEGPGVDLALLDRARPLNRDRAG